MTSTWSHYVPQPNSYTNTRVRVGIADNEERIGVACQRFARVLYHWKRGYVDDTWYSVQGNLVALAS